jgi:hypothetical protein
LYNPVEKLKRASGNEHAHRKIEEKLEVFVPLSILWRCGSILCMLYRNVMQTKTFENAVVLHSRSVVKNRKQ